MKYQKFLIKKENKETFTLRIRINKLFKHNNKQFNYPFSVYTYLDRFFRQERK